MNVSLFEPTRAARVLRAEMPGVCHNQALEIDPSRPGTGVLGFGNGATTLELRRQVNNTASCRMAAKFGFPLREMLPTTPPWPLPGHVRTA